METWQARHDDDCGALSSGHGGANSSGYGYDQPSGWHGAQWGSGLHEGCQASGNCGGGQTGGQLQASSGSYAGHGDCGGSSITGNWGSAPLAASSESSWFEWGAQHGRKW